MSAMPAGTGVNMATAGLSGAMCGPCGSVGAQSTFYPPNVPGGCTFGPPNVPGGCVFPSGESACGGQEGHSLGPVGPVVGPEGLGPTGGGSAPAGAFGPEGLVQEADDDSLANVSAPQQPPEGHDAAGQQRLPAQVVFSSGAREEQFRTQFGASGQADMAIMIAMLHSQGEALRSCMAEVVNLGRRMEQLTLERRQLSQTVGASGSVGGMNDASSGFGARVAPPHGQQFYGTPALAKPEKEEQDICTKSEKWLPALPTPQYEGWKIREQEILGFD